LQLVSIPIYDLAFPHKIIVLYVMNLASSYGVFLMFSHLFRDQDVVTTEGALLRRFRTFELAFHSIFLALFVLGFLPGVGAHCYEQKTYRKKGFYKGFV
jgi:hypothetical protein